MEYGTDRAYVENERNVDVLTFAVASKVIIDDSKQARGIQVERFGQSLSYFAKNEVILSAGAIGSPQALDSNSNFFTNIVQSCRMTNIYLN